MGQAEQQKGITSETLLVKLISVPLKYNLKVFHRRRHIETPQKYSYKYRSHIYNISSRNIHFHARWSISYLRQLFAISMVLGRCDINRRYLIYGIQYYIHVRNSKLNVANVSSNIKSAYSNHVVSTAYRFLKYRTGATTGIMTVKLNFIKSSLFGSEAVRY